MARRRTKKNAHAVALGRLGGKARAASLTSEELSEIGRKGGLKGGRGRMRQLSAEDREQFASSGGLVGGKARAAKLTPEQRKEIAKKAAAARWGKPKT